MTLRSKPRAPSQAERLLRDTAVRALIGLLVGLTMLVAAPTPWVRRLEARAHDRLMILWRQLKEADTSQITLVVVDDDTLAELHAKWPLSRAVYARAIDALRKAGASVIGVTIVFDGTSTDRLADQALASVLKGSDDVVLASRLDFTTQPPTSVAPPFECPSGFCDVPLDDGVARQFYVVAAGVNPPPTSLPLRLLRLLNKNMQYLPRGIDDDAGRLYPIAFAGGPGQTFRTVSLKRVLSGADLSHDVKGAIVLIGSTLPGPANSIRTPFSRGSTDAARSMSTVELTANVLFTLLGSETLQPLSTVEYSGLVIGLALICCVLFGWMHPLLSAACTGFLLVLYAVGATYALIMGGRMLPVAVPLLTILLAWLCMLVQRLVSSVMRRSGPVRRG